MQSVKASDLDHSKVEQINHQKTDILNCVLNRYVMLKNIGEIWSGGTAYAL
jgi:hypothetical protein